MSTSGSYQIETTSGTTTSLLSTSSPGITVPKLASPDLIHIAPLTSVIIGPGGSPGGGWPFQDFNMINDPEGDLSAYPAIFWDGQGGQAGDPFAFAPGADDNAGAGYANAGAAYTGYQVCQNALNDPTYEAGGTQLNDNNIDGACRIGQAALAQAGANINWSFIQNAASYGSPADIVHGAQEVFHSSGMECAATMSAAGIAAVGASALTGGIAGAAWVAVTLGGIYALGACGAMYYAGGMDRDESTFLATAYRAFVGDLQHNDPHIFGSQAVGPLVLGGTKVDYTMGGAIDYRNLTHAAGNLLGASHA